MLFSERYGYKKVPMLKKDEMPDSLKNQLWNVIYDTFFMYLNDETPDWVLGDMLAYRVVRSIWLTFLKGDKLTLARRQLSDVVDEVNKRYHKLQWYEVYDFVEFVLLNCTKVKNRKDLSLEIDKILQEEKAPYQVIDFKISPPLGDEEMKKEIEIALNIPDKFKPVREHLSKALDKWADRKNPDYKNSIGESIKAVECIVTIILGKDGTLGKLIEELNIHPALKAGFGNLYGWRSDESGIGHGKHKKPLSCAGAEARYMLITCSAFVNYVVAKFNRGVK